ncbi:MAG: family 16 glycosylhydrolase [Treponema sp.]|nr:family 16 glycosylhydrolase [Candidatus Treponema scatequi]
MKKINSLLAGAMVLSAVMCLTACKEKVEITEYPGYKLLWHDEFSGRKLDETIWNKEVREPGWTNHEMQAYTKDKENIYVKDGKLVLNAVQHKLKSGRYWYTSGKVQTAHKKDFKYGKICVRAKVPVGQGLWPAIWMMPTDEKYGNWPCSGEIDIMEVLGSQPEKNYGTIHYGSPHGQKQGTYLLKGTNFGEDFHEFSIEWEPGEFRWYVDGQLYYTENTWFATSRGGEDFEYPAPFNENFYLQMNLAVGGDWPGKPDETTDFTKSRFEIDYVRVYQKASYNENVKKPVVEFPKPDKNGNYIKNSNFKEVHPLDGSKNWTFLLANGGEGSAEIKDGQLIIYSKAAGFVDYSVQLVHPKVANIKGKKYRIQFDAKASGERNIKVAVTAPEVNWIRYFPDTDVSLTPNWKTYTFEYEMTRTSDPLARLEFQLGKQGSIETVYLKNVTLTELN